MTLIPLLATNGDFPFLLYESGTCLDLVRYRFGTRLVSVLYKFGLEFWSFGVVTF